MYIDEILAQIMSLHSINLLCTSDISSVQTSCKMLAYGLRLTQSGPIFSTVNFLQASYIAVGTVQHNIQLATARHLYLLLYHYQLLHHSFNNSTI